MKVPTDRNTIQISRGLTLFCFFFFDKLSYKRSRDFLFSNVSVEDFENIFAFRFIFGAS